MTLHFWTRRQQATQQANARDPNISVLRPDQDDQTRPRILTRARLGVAALVVVAGTSTSVALIEAFRGSSTTQITTYINNGVKSNSPASSTQNPASANQPDYQQALSAVEQQLQSIGSQFAILQGKLKALPSPSELKNLEGAGKTISKLQGKVKGAENALYALEAEVPQTGNNIVREGAGGVIAAIGIATFLNLRSHRKTRKELQSMKSADSKIDAREKEGKEDMVG